MSKTFIVAALFAVLLPTAAWAGGFCCQMPTGVEETGASGNFSLRADYTYSRMSEIYSGDSHKSLSSVSEDPRFRKMMGVIPVSMDMQRVTMSASYSPIKRLRVTLAVPWVINDMTMIMFMPATKWSRPGKMDQISDLGDITLMGSYRIYQDKDLMPSTAITVGAGVKFPSGPSTINNRKKRIHAHMQPGTGSWDPILTLSFMKMINSDFMVQADTRYEIATANGLGYSFGDTVAVNAYLKYNLTDYINLSLGANYFHSEQSDDPNNKYNGKVSKRLTDYSGYTGEDNIWVSPGFQIMPFKGASVDFRFQYPVYQHVRDIAQVTDYRLTTGISYSF